MRYLLDTNVLIHAARNAGQVRRRLQSRSPDEVATSVVTLAELLYGALKSSHPDKTRTAWLEMLAPLAVVDFTESSAHEHAKIRWALRHSPIGERDLLIASMAAAHGMVVVTHNQQEFRRVPGLLCEDWY